MGRDGPEQVEEVGLQEGLAAGDRNVARPAAVRPWPGFHQPDELPRHAQQLLP